MNSSSPLPQRTRALLFALLFSVGGFAATRTAAADVSAHDGTYPAACPATKVTADDSQRARALWISGKQFLEEAQYDKAINYFVDAYTLDCSKHELLYKWIARAYETKGDPASKRAAIVALELYLAREPKADDRDIVERRIVNLRAQTNASPPKTTPAPAPAPSTPATAATTHAPIAPSTTASTSETNIEPSPLTTTAPTTGHGARNTVVLIQGGLSLATLSLAIYFTSRALDDRARGDELRNDVAGGDPNNHSGCVPPTTKAAQCESLRETNSAQHSHAMLAYGFYATAGALALSSVVTFLVWPRSKTSTTTARPYFAPSPQGASGGFVLSF